jgi:nucleotide sugar dehydrogenase
MTTVAVVGLGKIGLPLAAMFAGKGATVVGCDIDATVVDAVNQGVSPIGGEPGLTEAVASAHAAGRLSATTETAGGVSQSQITIVVVRAAVDEARRPDYTALDAAADAIGRGLQPGSLVVLETTVPVGTTRQRFAQRLRDASGLAEGAFHVAYSPERVSSGTMFRDLKLYPKLVGGIDGASGEAAAAFYGEMLDAEIMLLPDAETAEFAKLAESIYRDVNIALANELAMAAESLGVDYTSAVKASNSQPYSHLHSPGVGVGGHCIPVYPYFLMQAGPQPLISLSRQVNDSMAAHAVDKLAAVLDEGLAGKTVLILGLAYRGGVKEAAFSSTHLLAAELRQRGAHVLVHDPLFSSAELAGYGLEATLLPPSRPIDAAILQAMHSEYRDLDLKTLRGCRVFLDGRGAFERAQVEEAGLRYLAIGLA